MRAHLYIEGSKEWLEALYVALSNQKESERLKSKLKLGNGLELVIEARDSTALRAGLNTYLRIIQVAEKFKR